MVAQLRGKKRAKKALRKGPIYPVKNPEDPTQIMYAWNSFKITSGWETTKVKQVDKRSSLDESDCRESAQKLLDMLEGEMLSFNTSMTDGVDEADTCINFPHLEDLSESEDDGPRRLPPHLSHQEGEGKEEKGGEEAQRRKEAERE